MSREEIIKMAREAEMSPSAGGFYWTATLTDLERFFHMAQAAEREACAKVCENSVEYAGDTLAQAIRARGQA